MDTDKLRKNKIELDQLGKNKPEFAKRIFSEAMCIIETTDKKTLNDIEEYMNKDCYLEYIKKDGSLKLHIKNVNPFSAIAMVCNIKNEFIKKYDIPQVMFDYFEEHLTSSYSDRKEY